MNTAKPGKFIYFCFYGNYVHIIVAVLQVFVVIGMAPDFQSASGTLLLVMALIRIPLLLCTLIIWIYCLRFWYKNDRYSKSGIWLLFLNCLYIPYYFRRVIVNPEREWINSISHEPVLGNKIHIEQEDDE